MEGGPELLNDKRIWNRGRRYLIKKDKVMANIVRNVGPIAFEIDGSGYYESLVESILFQQLAGSAARAILKKFKGLYNGRIPTPKEYLRTSEKRLRSAGISPQKYGYIKDLCERINDGRLKLEGVEMMSDEEVVTMLDEVKGIGRWTAEMFLLFSLGRVDVLPMDDLGFRKGIRAAYRLKEMPERRAMEKLSSKWRPYGSIATLYLWRGLDSAAKGKEGK
ncbi:MAG: DNA-3-methyladenine glycosylase 2 family protein [Candidatus Micrarchaeota archaeon]|nr:DNA-3-methyladenine glycosylase 2 family protein [Candidatus Micrarchaeota archaeon]